MFIAMGLRAGAFARKKSRDLILRAAYQFQLWVYCSSG
jgi:hypothetical protein